LTSKITATTASAITTSAAQIRGTRPGYAYATCPGCEFLSQNRAGRRPDHRETDRSLD
jgi:transposase